MIKVENSFDSTLIDMENIMIHSWQHSTMEEQINVSNNFILITISPSQFRSLLSSSSNSNSFARYILRYVLQKFPLSQQILVLIADQIQKYNISIFEHKNDECSMKIATSLGQKISSYFIQAYNELSFNDRQKIQIINWTDMLLSSNYDNHVQNIRQYINNNQEQCFPLIDKVKYIDYFNYICLQKKKRIIEIYISSVKIYSFF
uniref:Uncharacterized protein n=1 Tax=Adineta vaga TaxID=104782 RepID=B3G4M5_ADIVA|nr:unknown [Adineta vaga]